MVSPHGVRRGVQRNAQTHHDSINIPSRHPHSDSTLRSLRPPSVRVCLLVILYSTRLCTNHQCMCARPEAPARPSFEHDSESSRVVTVHILHADSAYVTTRTHWQCGMCAVLNMACLRHSEDLAQASIQVPDLSEINQTISSAQLARYLPVCCLHQHQARALNGDAFATDPPPSRHSQHTVP